MIYEYDLRVSPQTAATEQLLKSHVSEEKGISITDIEAIRVLRRSVDARRHNVIINLRVRVYVDEKPAEPLFQPIVYGDVSQAPAVVVVGAGPAGLFASLRLIELGLRPVLLERGKDVRERRKDLSAISRRQEVDAESNYCFGEGGAGTYSDGKLYTRSKKRGSIEKILRILCQFGASPAILQDARPHIGTDKLPHIIEAIRNQIIASGGEVRFRTKVIGLDICGSEVVGVKAVNSDTAEEQNFRGPVILATGHSARDVYRFLDDQQVTMEAKGIAVGVRLEHPAQLIDSIQYHRKEGRGQWLPAAEYSFSTRVDGRGVYSFCMCPGGVVIPAATDREQIVVNGMSPGNRGTRWSNSGMVVEILPEDIPGDDIFRIMDCQIRLEQMCWQQGNRRQTAPAQRMTDFVDGRLSYDLPETSYAPGVISSPLHFWMPAEISSRLRGAFRKFGQTSHGFLTREALVLAVETRTSSPVRILRDARTLRHVRFSGLYPCGEGAGYAGGIVSAAIDGERCAELCHASLHS